MAITEMGREELEELYELEAEETPVPQDRGPAWPAAMTARLSGQWAAFLTVAWITIFSAGLALEPAPANDEAMPFLGAVIASGLMVGWMVMGAGFLHRRRYGALGSLAAAGCLLVLTVACPVSGHHAGIGLWWFAQMAGALALVGASGAALRSGD